MVLSEGDGKKRKGKRPLNRSISRYPSLRMWFPVHFVQAEFKDHFVVVDSA